MKKVSSSLLLLLLFLSETMIHPSHSISDTQLDSICDQSTVVIEICTGFLKSDPRTASADLPGLLSIAVDLARSKANAALSMVRSLERKPAAADPVLKQRLRTCSDHYVSGRLLLDKAKHILRHKDYVKVGERARSALFRTKPCRDQFKDKSPAMPAQLEHMHFALRNLCDIVFTIAGQPGLK